MATRALTAVSLAPTTPAMIDVIVRKVRAHETMFRVLTHAQMHKQTALKLLVLRLTLLPSMHHTCCTLPIQKSH